MGEERLELAADLDAFDTPLRNIRVQLDGTTAIFDLIPSTVVDLPIPPADFSTDPKVNAAIDSIIAGGKPIVETEQLMRVWFEAVAAIFIQEEFVELDQSLAVGRGEYHCLKGGKGIYPFLRVENSRWKALLPDYQGGDSPELSHFKMFSMECHIDILGWLSSIEWLPNPSFKPQASSSMSQ